MKSGRKILWRIHFLDINALVVSTILEKREIADARLSLLNKIKGNLNR